MSRQDVGEDCRGHERDDQHGAGGAERLLAKEARNGRTGRPLEGQHLGRGHLDGLRDVRHHTLAYLIRGSTHAYSRSTTRFASTTTMAMNIVRFCTTG